MMPCASPCLAVREQDAASASAGPLSSGIMDDKGSSLAAPPETGDSVPSPDAGPPAPNTRRPHRRVFTAAFALGLATVVAISGAGVAAWDAGYEGRVLPGVHVGSVDLSGLDRAGAAEALAAAFPFGTGNLVLRTPDGDITIPYADFDRRVDADSLAEEALRSGRVGGVIERAVGEVRQALQGTTIAPRLAFDAAALTAAITAAVRTLERSPVDSTILMTPEGPVTTPAASGRTADPAPVLAAALAALRALDAPVDVVVPVEVLAVRPQHDDASVELAKMQAERIVGDIVIVWGSRTWTIDAATMRSWVRFEGRPDGSFATVVDTSQIPGTLDDVAKAVLREPVSATFLKSRGGKVIGAVAGKDGRRLDAELTVARIASELASRADGRIFTPVRVANAKVPPVLTTEQAGKAAPLMTRLGTWTTWFPISERNYFGANIWRPAQIIHGTVLKPGQRFEWWSGIGPVSGARGFGPGGIIRGSYTDPTGALGGGMCSSSTTLFNAALRAGLRIDARAQHRYYINRYPLGLDATVSIMGRSVQTMSFTNDTKHPVYIRGIRTRGAGGRGYVTYEIWGVSDGRTVTIGRPVVTNVRKAITEEVTVDTLPHGVREQTEFPSNAMDVSVTRVVHDAAGSVIRRDTFVSHYVLWNGLIEVGR